VFLVTKTKVAKCHTTNVDKCCLLTHYMKVSLVSHLQLQSPRVISDMPPLHHLLLTLFTLLQTNTEFPAFKFEYG